MTIAANGLSPLALALPRLHGNGLPQSVQAIGPLPQDQCLNAPAALKESRHHHPIERLASRLTHNGLGRDLIGGRRMWCPTKPDELRLLRTGLSAVAAGAARAAFCLC